jgi:hypothetical protein
VNGLIVHLGLWLCCTPALLSTTRQSAELVGQMSGRSSAHGFRSWATEYSRRCSRYSLALKLASIWLSLAPGATPFGRTEANEDRSNRSSGMMAPSFFHRKPKQPLIVPPIHRRLSRTHNHYHYHYYIADRSSKPHGHDRSLTVINQVPPFFLYQRLLGQAGCSSSKSSRSPEKWSGLACQ